MAKKKQQKPLDHNENVSSEPGIEETMSALDSESTQQNAFPVVGIGASAGGLDAFEEFFTHMPSNPGMAFVLVQHLDPDHESILVDLLKRCTEMRVVQVEDGMEIQPNHIYVIPPNRNMALLHGTLHLMEPVERRGLRMPIDFFFRSLAEDLAETAICVILSGTGTDGTAGLKAIRGEGGMTMVETPESAGYDGMPRSAIATEMVDFILPPAEMPAKLLSYTEHLLDPRIKRAVIAPNRETEAIEKVFVLLRSQTKHDFSLYKRNTISRRIERRMAVNQIAQAEDYVRLLQRTPREVDILFRELLIGVTSFFRDREAFEILEQKAIPEILNMRRPDQPIRVWVPGCSTGEEAYSIGMLLREQMSQREQEFEVQIFATDIDYEAVEQARLGTYAESLVADVSPERLRQFFIKDGSTYRIGKQIREMVIFAIQSVIKDPPFSRMDLISCRNLLIYLGPELQKRVIPLFHYALKPGGFLFLGSSETLGEFSSYFSIVDRKAKLFQRSGIEPVPPHTALKFTVSTTPDDEPIGAAAVKTRNLNVREVVEGTLLQEYTPPSVITNEQGDILYFHGKTDKYLEPVSGEASLNVLRMARDYIRIPLRAAFLKATSQKKVTVHENIQRSEADRTENVTLTIKPITKPDPAQGLFLIVFQDVAYPKRLEMTEPVTDERDRRLLELEQELQSTREYLQTTVEELETTNEELKSTNEELQSANEELQSTNEELETAKEELQSVNEELVTVNSELQNKIDELTWANNDLSNLLSSVEIGIVFLDEKLRIQRFNSSATELINLIESDVGRPVSHIVSNLAYDTILADTQEVLDTLVPKNVEAQTTDGRWYRVRIRPYRTIENAIRGAVLTFFEITQLRRVQEQLQQEIAERDLARQETEKACRHAERIVNSMREPMLVLDDELRVTLANQPFYKTFQMPREEVEGHLFYDLHDGSWNRAELQEWLKGTLAQNPIPKEFLVNLDLGSMGQRTMRLTSRHLPRETGEATMILLVMEDVTER